MAKKEEEEGIKVLSVNRKARYNFAITESFECGIELRGTEVKSMKEGRFSYADAFATVDNEQLWLVDFHISPYSHGNINNHDPLRRRQFFSDIHVFYSSYRIPSNVLQAGQHH